MINSSRLRKAQASSELLIMLGIILIIVAIILGYSGQKSAVYLMQKQKISAGQPLYQLTSEINSVYSAGDNTTRTVQLPGTLDDNTIYSITLYPEAKTAELRYNNKYVQSAIVAGNISGRLTGINGSVTLRNQGGVIVVS